MIFSSISYFTWENYYNLFDEINNSDFEKIIFRKSNKCSIEKHLIGYSTSDADCN